MPIQRYRPDYRKLSDGELAPWRDIPPAIVSDMMNRTQVMDGKIKPVQDGMKLCGQARTVTAMVGDGPTLVSAAVYLESKDVAELRGVQLRGYVSRQRSLGATESSRLTSLYLRAHPVARAALESSSPPSLYVLEIGWAKLTDNRLGFGTHRRGPYAETMRSFTGSDGDDPQP